MISVMENIASYRVAARARREAEHQASTIGLQALVANERKLAERLKPALSPNWPYPLEPGVVVIRRRGLFYDRLETIVLGDSAAGSPRVVGAAIPATSAEPAPAVPVVPATPAAASAFGALARSTLQMVVAVTIATFIVSGGFKNIHVPEIHNPFIKPPAYTAGVAEAQTLLANLAGSFHQASADVKAGKGLLASKEAHVKRLPGLVKLPADAPIVKILDAIVPPGTDGNATAQQQADYAKALGDFADGLASKSK